MSTKAERRMESQLGRVRNLVPGQARIWRLERIASMTRYEADQESGEAAEHLADDALFLERLAWDLAQMHDAIYGRRASLDTMDPRP